MISAKFFPFCFACTHSRYPSRQAAKFFINIFLSVWAVFFRFFFFFSVRMEYPARKRQVANILTALRAGN